MLVYKKWKSVGKFFFQPNSHSPGCFFVSPQASTEVRIQDGARFIKLQVIKLLILLAKEAPHGVGRIRESFCKLSKRLKFA